MAVALIMAGGNSARMHASGVTTHKALVPVLGVPLIERNVLMLLSAGITDIVIAFNPRQSALQQYVQGRARALAFAREARLDALEEVQPLGTIGAARELASRQEPVLIVNVDNLTAIDINGLIQSHVTSASELTIATHSEPFRIPFGEVVMENGRVSAYLEKPIRSINVSSGMYVLSPRACGSIPGNQRFDLPDLFHSLAARGESVHAFPHTSPWIDINDESATRAAARLVCEHRERFECWVKPPDRERTEFLLVSPAAKVLVECEDGTGDWWLPKVEAGTVEEGLSQALRHLGWPGQLPSSLEPLTCFDDLDTGTGKLTRHRVFLGRVAGEVDLPRRSSASRWMGLDDFESVPVSSSLRRSVAWLRQLP